MKDEFELTGDIKMDLGNSFGLYEAPSFDNMATDEFAEDISSWSMQETGFTCAIASQKMILQQFGIDVSEAQLVYEATSGGFLTSGGTSTEDIGRLLEMHGVQTHQSFGVTNLIRDLSHGHKVIIAVDSGEIWGSDGKIEDWFLGEHADHALVINGLDLSDPDNPQAVLNDPGHPNGAGMRVSLNCFLDAWNDSDMFYVATDEAPPELTADPDIGNGFRLEAGMYFDNIFWNRFLEARGLLLNNIVQNLTDVSTRFMTEGTIDDAFIGAIISSIATTLVDLTNERRDELFRDI